MQFNADTKFTRVNSLSSLTTLEAPGGSSVSRYTVMNSPSLATACLSALGRLSPGGGLWFPTVFTNSRPPGRCSLQTAAGCLPTHACRPWTDHLSRTQLVLETFLTHL